MNYSFDMSDILEGSGYDVDMENATLTCAASSLQSPNRPELHPSVDIAIRVTTILFHIMICTLGLFLNFLIIYLVAKFRELKNLSFCIAVQIIVADLCIIIFDMPNIANQFSGRWILGIDFCIVSAFCKLVAGSVRSNLVTVFAFDRFATVFAPFNYPKYSHKVTGTFCVICWCISFATSVTVLPPLLDCYTYLDAAFFCAYSNHCNMKCQIFHYVLLATHMIPVMTIPIGFFGALYMKGIKIRCKDSATFGQSSRNMTRKEWRATRTFLLLFLFVTLTPATFFFLLDRLSNYFLAKLVSRLLHFTFITDTTAILFNADAKEALWKLMKRVKTSIKESKCYKLRSAKNSCVRNSNNTILNEFQDRNTCPPDSQILEMHIQDLTEKDH